MSSNYRNLLDATADYLKQLKAEGTQYVSVSPELLAGLSAQRAPRVQARAPVASPARPMTILAQAPAAASVSITPTPEVAPANNVMPLMDLAASAPSTPEEKADGIAKLRERALVCQKCPSLVRSRKNVVFGVGDINSPLMFIGEAPGADEDAKGEPFVGKAGQLLTKIIQTMGLSRDTVYIANILKCRPDTPGQTFGNRKPTVEEMKTCLPYLLAQIDLIQPKVMVALGGTAVEGLLGLTTPISRLRGHFQSFRGVPVMPTYHPSYLLRNEGVSSIKREAWEDMLMVLEKLGRPTTEKQRNYFLKAAPGN